MTKDGGFLLALALAGLANGQSVRITPFQNIKAQASATFVANPGGITVYDSANNVTWLADFNLPATNRFGLPVCSGPANQVCVNASGSMRYESAVAWVQAMNAANYLGHKNWQLPTSPLVDKTCGKTGPNGGSFGFGCAADALATVYNASTLKSPNTAVPIPNNTVGPFSNFQPYLYWSQTSAGPTQGNATFSFATGWQGANTLPNFLYLLPMIKGKIAGTPAPTGNGLQVNPDKQTVYDPMTNITWAANANLAATNTFGLPLCKDPTTPSICVASDGAMTWDSAMQFIANMNSTAYLGQTHWEAPTVDPSCPGYNCFGDKNPMGNLFYNQLGFSQGMTAVAAPNIAVGLFHNIQPYLYWSCQAATIQGACETDGPAPNFEWSYSFGSGFQGTDLLANDLYVTAYFAGQAAVPVISKVANAEGESPTIAPNTWVEVKGSNLAPEGDTRIWQSADFVNGKMPIGLDGVGVTVNGKPAYVYYISPTQIDILTPVDAISGSVPVVVTNSGIPSASFTAQAQALSPSFFVFNDGRHVAAVHADGSLLGPTSFSVPGYPFTPAKPGETVLIYANGFGPTNTPLVSGSSTQSGQLTPAPVVTIGGVKATVTFAGLVAPGEFQFNVVIPSDAPGGDQPIAATYNGTTTQAGTLFTMTGTAPATSVTFYVAPNGKDSWSGTLAAANLAGTDGPFATFERARAAVQAQNKAGLTQITVQFREGDFLPSAVHFTAADSGLQNLRIVYQNYPGESPVFSGGAPVRNWTNTSGNIWTATLPASTQYFENLFYNGGRRLRPRLGGYLGTFYRVASTIYLTAPPPPAAAPNANCPVYVAGSGWECFDRFQYSAADPISSSWKNLAPPSGNPCGQPAGNPALAGDIELLDFEQFMTSKLRISCVDPANHVAYMTGPTASPQNSAGAGQTGFIAGHRYLVENVQDQLNQPGQWFLDRSTTPWKLTYLARPGENPNTDTVVIPQLAQVLVASDLQFVTFRGLTFENDNFTVPAAGYDSHELDADISAAVSLQNSQQIVFDADTVTQTSGAGLEIISCIDAQSPSWCVSRSPNAVTSQVVVQNSAFYDLGASGIRIAEPARANSNDSNVPQFITAENNVVEGYGRTFPSVFGIAQGAGHDNTYTHNDVYDGYHVAISVCQCAGDIYKPAGAGTFNNTISFNHVYNLHQGIMNDGGSIRIGTGNSVFTAAGNKILNNKIHDVSDASALDSDGYGGHGVYLDNQTGLVDVENNLVYRVSGNAVNMPQGPVAPNEPNIIKNNILAFARLSMINVTNPFSTGMVPSSAALDFIATSNLFYFDRSSVSSPPFFTQGGCAYIGGFALTALQQWNSNLYWRADGGFAADAQTFHVQPLPGPMQLCAGNANRWTFYTFADWQQKLGEDLQGAIRNPGFANPAYPADDFSLPKGSPGVGFVVFDPSQAGRSNPALKPPAVPATFPTKPFNPATDY